MPPGLMRPVATDVADLLDRVGYGSSKKGDSYSADCETLHAEPPEVVFSRSAAAHLLGFRRKSLAPENGKAARSLPS